MVDARLIEEEAVHLCTISTMLESHENHEDMDAGADVGVEVSGRVGTVFLAFLQPEYVGGAQSPLTFLSRLRLFLFSLIRFSAGAQGFGRDDAVDDDSVRDS